MSLTTEIQASPEQRALRLEALRARMRELQLDVYIVRGTDAYLNEYVPINDSSRAWLSGFTGSIADLLICADQAKIYVDGRYHLQADKETDPAHFDVVKVEFGTRNEEAMYKDLRDWVQAGKRRVGFAPERFSVAEHKLMRSRLQDLAPEWLAYAPSLVETLRGASASRPGKLRVVGPAIAGRSVEQKITTLRSFMTEHKLDALVVTALDDIAYLSNLRGQEIAFQSTFRAKAVLSHSDFVLALPGRNREKGLELSTAMRIVAEKDWAKALPQDAQRVGFDEGSCNEATRQGIAASGAQAVAVTSPVSAHKALKNPSELRHMIRAFRDADKAILATQGWLHRRVDKGEVTTEADLAHEMARRFKRSGGYGLSFEVISAAGANGAVIHYSDPDPKTPIAPGTMVLLDTGTYYEGGYATDLTRTFLAGRKNVVASERQKYLFTLVLKGAIAGMSARFPVGTQGNQIDALCRQYLWREGLQYLHGTGHGVGINVHESPPRVSSMSSLTLEPSQVFSIEPGIYIAGEGGVRIENLCTVVEDSTPGLLRVVPLTFSPLDKRLIDKRLLSKAEQSFLKWYEAQWKLEAGEIPSPPPLV